MLPLKLMETVFNGGANGVSIAGNLKYDNDIAPYIGFGFAPKFSKNWVYLVR